MRRLYVMILWMSLLVGCTQPVPYRTGTIVLQKFGIEDYKNPNPVAIRKDVAESLRDTLHRELLAELQDESKLKIGKDCGDADFELTGRFVSINQELDSHYRFVTVTVEQKFEVGVQGQLKRCRSDEVLVTFDEMEDDEDMSNLLDNLASYIVSEINRDRTGIKPTVASKRAQH